MKYVYRFVTQFLLLMLSLSACQPITTPLGSQSTATTAAAGPLT